MYLQGISQPLFRQFAFHPRGKLFANIFLWLTGFQRYLTLCSILQGQKGLLRAGLESINDSILARNGHAG